MNDQDFTNKLRTDLLAEAPAADPEFWETLEQRLVSGTGVDAQTSLPKGSSRFGWMLAAAAAVLVALASLGIALRSPASDIETASSSSETQVAEEAPTGESVLEPETSGEADDSPSTTSPGDDTNEPEPATPTSGDIDPVDEAMFPLPGVSACYTDSEVYAQLFRDGDGKLGFRQSVLMESDIRPNLVGVDPLGVTGVTEAGDVLTITASSSTPLTIRVAENELAHLSGYVQGAVLSRVSCEGVAPILNNTTGSYELPPSEAPISQ